MNATPRPWDFEGMTIIEKATRKRLMVLSNALGSDGVMEHEGNCEILLNAVNSYDAMKEALEQAIARIEVANQEGNPIMSAWLPDAKAALALAKGEQ